MAVIIHPSHLIHICVFMSGERTKVPASNMPHTEPGVISSQHFLSLTISTMTASVWVEGSVQKHSVVCSLCKPSFQHLISNTVKMKVTQPHGHQ